MLILGLNAYHGDSSACLVSDGKLLCAIEEERIRRIKHWAGLPTESLKWCLQYAGAQISDVDYIAVSRDPSAHLHKKILRVLSKAPSFNFLKNRFQNVSKIKDLKTSIADSLDLDKSVIKAVIQNVEHHRAHIASSFLLSLFDKSDCVSVDGFGDYLSVMRGSGVDNKIEIHDWVEYPHSLGIFYTALTQFLGFNNYGDEYKVMGLSAYGENTFEQEMNQIIKLNGNGLFKLDTSYFQHDKEGVDMVWEGGMPSLGQIFSSKINDLLGSPRDPQEGLNQNHKDMAFSIQAMYEKAYFNLLNSNKGNNSLGNLSLAGGCIQNSLANGKIYENTDYENIYIPPASYDAGTAIGAAYWVWNIVLDNKRDFVMDNPYLGPEFSNKEIESLLIDKKVEYIKLNENELYNKTATAISEGKIVGWFHGRTEWGPRALGNRSILADPRNRNMKDILNARIKKRESFRPFAPSVLEECTGEWFENSHPVPFMEKVYLVNPDKRHLIPAVVHEDGTGRLQTVSKSMNDRYYKLIKEFNRLTNVPILLNTSFNENEPIVNTPNEALDCFRRTKMDILVLNDFYIERK
jgi:carbamoyltransferase